MKNVHNVLVLTSLAVFLLIGVIYERSNQKTEGPKTEGPTNVVLVIFDFMRWDDFGYYNKHNTTPFLSSFLDTPGSLVYPNAVLPSTWTYPSHASILTGEMPFDMEVDLHMANQSYIDPKYPTIIEVAKSIGYDTFLIADNGYSILNPIKRYSLHRGLDYFDAWASRSRFYTNTRPFTEDDHVVFEALAGNERPVFQENAAELTDFSTAVKSFYRLNHNEFASIIAGIEPAAEVYPPLCGIYNKYDYDKMRQAPLRDYLAARSIADKKNPFLLVQNLHYYLSNRATQNTIFKEWFIEYLKENGHEQRLRNIVGDGEFMLPNVGQAWNWDQFDWYKFISRYAVSFGDCQIQALSELLNEVGESSNTAFVITTDHGSTYGAHDGRPDGHGLTFPFGSLVNSFVAIRNPPSVRSEKAITEQIFDENLVSVVDVFPTVLELLDRDLYLKYLFKFPNRRSLIDRHDNAQYVETIVSESIVGPNGNGKLGNDMPALGYAFYNGEFKLIWSPGIKVADLFHWKDDRDDANPVNNIYKGDLNKLLRIAEKYYTEKEHAKLELTKDWRKEFKRSETDEKSNESLIKFFKDLGYLQ